jgi:hypothetical protein
MSTNSKQVSKSDDLVKIPKAIIEESKKSNFLIKKEFTPKSIWR